MLAMGKLTLASVDVVADGFAQPFAIMGSTDDRLVQHAAGFFRHPEASLVDLRIDFFRRVPHERQFEIMNNSGSVHGHGGDDPLLHEVHENRAQSDFDHMGAESHDNGPAFAMGLHDGLGDRAQRFHAQDIRQRAIELAEAASSAPGAGKIGDANLAVPFLERIGREVRHVDRRDQARSRDGGPLPVRRLCQGAVPR